MESDQLSAYPERMILIVNKTRQIGVEVNRIQETNKGKMEVSFSDVQQELIDLYFFKSNSI